MSEDDEVKTVKLAIRSKLDGPHIFSDVVAGHIEFAPGEVKTLEMSESAAKEVREGTSGWELASKRGVASEPKAKTTKTKKAKPVRRKK
jgi:hypothetical protein